MGRMTSSGIAALFQDYRRYAGSRLWAAFGLMVAGAVAEGFGLLMIVPLANAALDPRGRVVFAPYASFAEGWTGGQWFTAALALFLGAMALRALILFARDVLLARLQVEYEADLRFRSAATLAGRGWPLASRIGQDGMQALLLTDVPRAAQATAYVQMTALAAVMLMVQFVIAFALSPALAAVALAFMILGALFSARLAVRGARSGFVISDSMEESAASGFRLHAGLKASLAQGTTSAFLAEYRVSLSRAAGQYARFAKDIAGTRQAAGFAASVAAAVVLLVGVQFLALPVPVLVASLAIFARMSAPAQMLQSSSLQAVAYAPAFAAIERRLGTLKTMTLEASVPSSLKWQRLSLENVSYAYPSGRGVSDISFELNAGRWLALTGESGSGKTTLVDLVTGLLEPFSGMMTVDGDSLRGASLRGWQAGIAYVGQDGVVFSDSIRGNLLTDAASDEELWTILEIVGLSHRIQMFRQGLDEPVGDRGSQLSGGERQRLVIARALLRKPSLLILDEATAALDAESEALLIERLRALEPRPAALVIAHRESTLAHCDCRFDIQHDRVRAGTLFR